MTILARPGNVYAHKLCTSKLYFQPVTAPAEQFFDVGNILKHKIDFERKAGTPHKTAQRGWKFIDDEQVINLGLKINVTVDEHWEQTRKLLFAARTATTVTQEAILSTVGVATLGPVVLGKTYFIGKRRCVSVVVYRRRGCTMDITTDKVTLTAHGFLAGQAVRFLAGDALPTGLEPATTYYVVNPTANDFQVALTAGGEFIDMSVANGTGHSVLDAKSADTDYTIDLNAGAISIHGDPAGTIPSSAYLHVTYGCNESIRESYDSFTSGYSSTSWALLGDRATFNGNFRFYEYGQDILPLLTYYSGTGSLWVSNDGDNKGSDYNQFELTLRASGLTTVRTRP